MGSGGIAQRHCRRHREVLPRRAAGSPRRRLRPLQDACDLERLARRVAEGRLDVQIDLVVPWEDAGSAVTKLLGGEVAGKAVLTL